MSSTAVHAIDGGRDRPRWAPSWAPSATSLEYIQKLASVVFLVLGIFYFLGVRSLKGFAARHIAAV